MKRVTLLAALIAVTAALTAHSEPSASAAEKKPAESPSSIAKLMGDAKGANEPTTTEIYADEAFFDSNKNVGTFTGHVKVADPRFNLQSDKLTVYISKGENQGLEKAIAEGNVGVVRDRPDPSGSPNRAVGRSETATYVAATGNVELRGTPRVQQGENTHIGTSPDTVMILNQKGQLTTHGASRTEIRQQPKDENDKGAANGTRTSADSKAPRKEGAKPAPQKP